MQDIDTHPSLQRLAVVTETYRAKRTSGPELWNAQVAVQEEANRIAETDSEGAREFLIAVANVTHAPYPQFVGYWDDWALGVLTRNLRLKGGSLPAGDVVLANPKLKTVGDKPSRSFYSARRDSNVSTEPRRVRRSV